MISFKIFGCAGVNGSRNHTLVDNHLARAEDLAAEGFFWQAISEQEKALKLCRNQPPADKVLHQIGRLLIDSRNSEPDYDRSLATFRQLAYAYPKSPYLKSAESWIFVIEGYIDLRERLAKNELAIKSLNNELQHKQVIIQSLKDQLKILKEQLNKMKQIDLELNRKRVIPIPGEE